MNNKQLLPRFNESMTYIYIEHARIEKEDNALAAYTTDGIISIPCASISLIMLGPGTSITHNAIKTMADNGCSVVWCGEEGIRFYAEGFPDTFRSGNMLKQAFLMAIPQLRMKVVRKMYELRFSMVIPEEVTLQQLRGMEGARVRDTYAKWSKKTGIPWNGRSYKMTDFNSCDSINKALSWANSCLYGIVHAGILSLGYSPALGFIHTGKQLSFVYDMADLYKCDITIPVAFSTVEECSSNIEKEVRKRCRDAIVKNRLLDRIVRDLDTIINCVNNSDLKLLGEIGDNDIGTLWDGFTSASSGGKQWGEVINDSDGI